MPLCNCLITSSFLESNSACFMRPPTRINNSCTNSLDGSKELFLGLPYYISIGYNLQDMTLIELLYIRSFWHF